MEPDAPVEPTVVKITSPADIVGMLPHRLGFHPKESLVVVCLEGDRRRDRLVMRLDLCPSRLDERVAQEMADRVNRAGASNAVLVCYTDAPVDDAGLARAGLVGAVVKRLRDYEIGVIDALLVRNGRWWSYHCTDESCCPGSGSPVTADLTPAASHYAAESVMQGTVVMADREALVRSIEPSSHAVAVEVRAQAVDAAAVTLGAAIARDGRAAAGRLTIATLRRLVEERAAGGADPSAEDAAIVALGLCDLVVRDQAMTLVLDHADQLFVTVLTQLARLVDDVDAAPLCTVLAWAAYAEGGGAMVAVAAERALRCDPGYEMAQLLLTGLSCMVRPSLIRDVAAAVRTDLEGLDEDLSA